MTKSRIFLAGGLLAVVLGAALVFGVTAGYGGAASSAQPGADEVTAKTISDADLQRMRERGEAMLARLQTDGSSVDGINVHGAWTLDIRNPDGTLAKHVEFENALEPDGADYLASLLAGVDTVGVWNLTIVTSPGICGPDELPTGCSINTDPEGGLTVEVIEDSGADILRLSGEVVAARDGTVFEVKTRQGDPSIAFTHKILALEDQADVVAGQQILVKVDITFN